MKTTAIAVAAGLGLVLGATSAQACKGSNVKFSDDFRQVDDSWGVDQSGDAVTVEGGKVKIKADPNSGWRLLYGGLTFDDADLCLTVQVPHQMTNNGQMAAGPIFWGTDGSNYYTFDITPDGRAAIERRLKGKWVEVLGYRKAQGAKTEPGDKNVLRVTTNGNNITAYINDVKFASVKGQVPDGGGEIGLYAESEQAHRDTWKFSDLKVTDLPQ